MGDTKADPGHGASPPADLIEAGAAGRSFPPATESLTETQRALVERNLALVQEIATSQHWRLFRLDHDDLIGAGQLGLIQAAQRYQPDHGIPFRGFAYYRIRGAMLDLARKTDRPGRRSSIGPVGIATAWAPFAKA